jgi:hypothetical protein
VSSTLSRATLVLALTLLLAACGGGSTGEPGTETPASSGELSWSAEALGREAQRAPVTAMLVNSAPGVGVNRLSFGLIERSGQLVLGATDVKARLYTLEGDLGTPVSEHNLRKSSLPLDGTIHVHSDGSEHLHAGPEVAMYVTVTELTRGDWWGAEVTWTAGGRSQRQRVRFFVRPDTPEPSIGEPAPRSVQKTLRDGIPLDDLDTSKEPHAALHEQTIEEAVTSGKVSVIAFATPAFCQTRFCGPVVEAIVVPAWQHYGDRINVLHIEPFDVPSARSGQLKAEPVTAEWHLESEPWVFVVGKDGTIAAKFEGIVSREELTEAIDGALRA